MKWRHVQPPSTAIKQLTVYSISRLGAVEVQLYYSYLLPHVVLVRSVMIL